MIGEPVDFESLWYFVSRRMCSIQQDKQELEHIFNLMRNCTTYLEIGCAEGSSMHVLGHALRGHKPCITYVDYGEKHTEPYRDEVIDILRKRQIHVRGVHGVSYNYETVKDASILQPFDAVLIDAGHDYASVVADAMLYGSMARKYIIFHDIQLPEVKAAFDFYVKAQGFKKVKTFINSPTFGYGVIEL